MDEFSYLSVLIGLILGLGITQMMKGIGRMLQLRDRIIWYWTGKIWILVILIFHVQAWWAMYELRNIPHWTFPAFFVVLLQPVLLFLLSALALPDSIEDSRIDLQAAFRKHAPLTFQVATMMILASLLKEYVLYARLPQSLNLAFHFSFLLLFITGWRVRTERCYFRVVSLSAGLLGLYTATLFTNLN